MYTKNDCLKFTSCSCQTQSTTETVRYYFASHTKKIPSRSNQHVLQAKKTNKLILWNEMQRVKYCIEFALIFYAQHFRFSLPYIYPFSFRSISHRTNFLSNSTNSTTMVTKLFKKKKKHSELCMSMRVIWHKIQSLLELVTVKTCLVPYVATYLISRCVYQKS